MTRKLLLVFILLISVSKLFAQGETYNWCFGDSAYLKFVGGAMVAQPYSVTESIEANASISDKSGNLLFYTGSPSQNGTRLRAFDKNHMIMPNGDSLYGYSSSTNGVMIVPFPGDTTKYYVFSNRIDPMNPINHNYNLCKNVIDITQNGGCGDVVEKNIVVLNQHVCEKMALTKHGNGKDWWFIVHDTDSSLFYIYLIDSSGIQNPIVQSLGAKYNLYSNLNGIFKGHWGEMVFSNDGSKLVAASNLIIDYFQFDRCTGILSNYQSLLPMFPVNYDTFYGCAFSPNGRILYMTLLHDSPALSSQLYQFDLSAPNISASRLTIDSLFNSTVYGQLELAPDGKIYVVTGHNGFPNYIYDSTSMYLSTIENPDNLGLACNLQKHSVYLGGHRAFIGLPNMPHYDLGALTGSPCDTITGLALHESGKIEIYPNPFTSVISITLPGQNKYPAIIKIINILGQNFLNQEIEFNHSDTKTIDLSFLENGIYMLEVIIDGERIVKKLVKE